MNCYGRSMRAWMACAFCLVIARPSWIFADDPPASVAIPPGAVQPEIGPIQKVVTLSGVFAATGSTEISVDLESSLQLKIVKSVEHGSTVRSGDVLVEFDTSGPKESLALHEHALGLLRLNLEESEREHRIAETKAPLEAESAELNKRRADEDYAFFVEREFPMSEKANEQFFKSAKDYLDYTAEELRQLEKMYKADDLTEESEEIVLRRARDDLARSQFSLEQSQLNYQRAREKGLPRTKANEQTAHRLAEIAFEQYRALQPLVREKRIAAIKKQRMELEKAEKEFEELKRDLKKLRLEAPHDGVVYFGKATDGKFANIAELTNKLRPHGVVAEHEVLMTIVRPGALTFRSSVSEVEVAHVAPGAVGHVVPTAYPGLRIDAKVHSVGEIPSADGSFAVQLDLQSDVPRKVVAGMTGKARWVAQFNAKALTIPSRLIHEDADEDGAKFVHVLDSEMKPQKRWVESGIVSGDRTEILSGIAADEHVVEAPAEKK